MHAPPPLLAAALARPAAPLCRLMTLTRRDGLMLRLTDHDRDVTDETGATYQALGLIGASAVAAPGRLAPLSLEADLTIADGILADDDLAAGRWEGATVTLMLALWDQPAAGRFTLAEALIAGTSAAAGPPGAPARFTASFTDRSALLDRDIGVVVTQLCRHRLGDPLCRVDVAALARAGRVVASDGRERLCVQTVPMPPADFARGGLVRFTDGRLAGVTRLVLDQSATGWLTLAEPLPWPAAAHDGVQLEPGCDKRDATCRARFNNGVNFGGFPSVPTADRATAYPDSRA